jgi:hypothetical protein
VFIGFSKAPEESPFSALRSEPGATFGRGRRASLGGPRAKAPGPFGYRFNVAKRDHLLQISGEKDQ